MLSKQLSWLSTGINSKGSCWDRGEASTALTDFARSHGASNSGIGTNLDYLPGSQALFILFPYVTILTLVALD